MIQISLIDSWAASAAGAYILAENNLYTLQAFEAYINRLDSNGILAISRWALKDAPFETVRFVTLAIETLKKCGINNPPHHIAVVRCGRIGTVLIKSTPFNMQEIIRLNAQCMKMDFEILYLPGHESRLPLLKMINQHWNNLPSVFNQIRLDLSAPTDDKPFFSL